MWKPPHLPSLCLGYCPWVLFSSLSRARAPGPLPGLHALKSGLLSCPIQALTYVNQASGYQCLLDTQVHPGYI